MNRMIGYVALFSLVTACSTQHQGTTVAQPAPSPNPSGVVFKDLQISFEDGDDAHPPILTVAPSPSPSPAAVTKKKKSKPSKPRVKPNPSPMAPPPSSP